ncbi:MAG: HAMP domain-containing histidine kinase [Proteobacteria bacterium]|nr:HAMP domain-containing histidine kinase [Pseudomonadota bacterium]MBU1710440.1 HAMP domain-containing histidine kinase [Pseudomonadota bacterium]
METYFAKPERLDGAELLMQIKSVVNNPITEAVLKSVTGCMIILNEYRQILASNISFLELIGITSIEEIIGLRPGEAINCVHAYDALGGCGTTRYCSTCGAAVAIVTSLGTDHYAERKCAATVKKNGKDEDLFLHVRSTPVNITDKRFLVVLLQDITTHERRAALERMFFHDLNNIMNGLIGASEILTFIEYDNVQEIAGQIKHLCLRLSKEVAIQRALSATEVGKYQIYIEPIQPEIIVRDIQNIFAVHPASKNKIITIPEILPNKPVITDYSLLMRILTNMITNALEATDEGGKVKFWIESCLDTVNFLVWSKKNIPDNIALRIFQRHFSTKNGDGRGFGTYSMKIFGEHFLNGQVDFISTPKSGTTFSLSLPA